MSRTVALPSGASETRNGNPVVVCCVYLEPRGRHNAPAGASPAPEERAEERAVSVYGSYKYHSLLTSDTTKAGWFNWRSQQSSLTPGVPLEFLCRSTHDLGQT
jgi:hypothetical protein